jgi:hypothetical protein
MNRDEARTDETSQTSHSLAATQRELAWCWAKPWSFGIKRRSSRQENGGEHRRNLLNQRGRETEERRRPPFLSEKCRGWSQLALAGKKTQRDAVPESHYGGHMERACGCVDACGWSLGGLVGFVRRRSGARGSWYRPTGHRALGGTHRACGRSRILSGCARKFCALRKRRHLRPDCWPSWAAVLFGVGMGRDRLTAGVLSRRRTWERQLNRGHGRRDGLRRTLA